MSGRRARGKSSPSPTKEVRRRFRAVGLTALPSGQHSITPATWRLSAAFRLTPIMAKIWECSCTLHRRAGRTPWPFQAILCPGGGNLLTAPFSTLNYDVSNRNEVVAFAGVLDT